MLHKIFFSRCYLLIFTFIVYSNIGICGSCYNFFKRIDSVQVQNPNQLRVMTYNMLNLYMHVGNYSKRSHPSMSEKPRWALNQMEGLFIDHPFDILVAQEVESVASAKLFNKEYLNDEFEVMATTTHDRRGLYVVFFVRKDLPFSFELESHVREQWKDPIDETFKEVFPRDIPTLHLYEKGKENGAPFLTMMGVHFKSLRDRDSYQSDGTLALDEGSYKMREAQANRATQIIQRYQLRYGLEHPILIAGDFNNSHNYSPEYYGFFRHVHLQDSLVLAGHLEFIERVTHTYFGNGHPEHHQLDGVLVVPALVSSLLDSYVIPYYNRYGKPRPLPRTKDERKRNPSDHRPVLAVFDLQILMNPSK